MGVCSKLDVLTSVADPVLFLPLDPGSGMEEIQIQDPRSGMNILDLIIVNLVAVLLLKMLKLFDADADPGYKKSDPE